MLLALPVTDALAFARLIEEPKPVCRVEAAPAPPSGDDSDVGARRLPFDLVTGTNSVALGERLGDGDLELARDLRHDPYSSKDHVLVKFHSSPLPRASDPESSSVFRLKQEPWIDPDGASRDEVIATVRKCPSGALSYSVGGVEQRGEEGEPAIFVAPNGPYVVTGGAELVDTALGEGASTQRSTLCRCGGSKNKPFCDGTHWSIEFTDDKN